MPIYEYRCDQGHTFEVMQRMVDGPVTTCETCAAPVQRVFHPIAVHFKGKGFYNTDYGTQKRQREKESSEASSKAEASKAKAKDGDSPSKSSSSEGASKAGDSKPKAASGDS